MKNPFHTPALLKEAIELLNVQAGKRYIDATIGGGGHTFEILRRGGIVLGIDIDQEAIEYVKEKIRNSKHEIRNLTLVRGNFKNIEEIARSHGFREVAGILFDLGVSSHQLGEPRRGFSFQTDGPLDMRMSARGGSVQAVTAADLVNGLTKKELYELFTKLAQEPNSWAISNAIFRARKVRPITTTKQLASLVAGVYSRIYKRRFSTKRRSKIHPATKVFQALRIAVNDELNNLKRALPQAIDLLEVGARVVIISFHSLEDKIVKDFGENEGLNILTKKPIIPARAELKDNPRARSAKMRVYEKQRNFTA